MSQTGGSKERKPQRRTTIQRFMDMVEKSVSGCWLWTGGLSADGYARLSLGAKSGTWAHRWSYEHHVGPIPEGFQIDHLCRVRHCVNPAHLEPVTPRENTMRSTAVPAQLAARDTCHRGHPFDGENLRMYGTVRVCRTCKRETMRRLRERRRNGSSS